jgi:hypothetical protein
MRLVTLALTWYLIALWPLEPAVAERVGLVVIVHPGTKATQVHVSELRALYLRQAEYIAGERLIPLNYAAGTSLRVDFDTRVLGLTPQAVGRYWVDARIRGIGLPPRSVALPQLVLRTVAALPGAIGYVPKSILQGAAVKVLRVDGLTDPL